jgi:hypothetical protein
MRKHSAPKSRDDRNTENEARPDELGKDPAQVGPDSAGQSGDVQGSPKWNTKTELHGRTC